MARDLPKQTSDVDERLSSEHEKQKAENKMFQKILQNLRFLARQGFALRGHSEEAKSNFTQLLHLQVLDTSAFLDWIRKKTNKYTSSDIQNGSLQVMALSILRQVCSNIASSDLYAVMADECTDMANKEQFVVCLRSWIDESCVDHEDVIGIYNVGTIEAKTLATAIKDVLLRMGLSIDFVAVSAMTVLLI